MVILKRTPNMNKIATVTQPQANDASPLREWLGSIRLGYEHRRQRSVLVDSLHYGPLRVQRPFYPEADGTCHTYLLHPPGGMAVGDQLSIQANCAKDTKVLLTTPSAGKMYGMAGIDGSEHMPQQQIVTLNIAPGAQCEWLPQETIVFNGANARLNTTIKLGDDAKFLGWDIVRLGRKASGEQFTQGQCLQNLRLEREGELIFIENNPIVAASGFQTARAGLNNKSTVATFIATVSLNRDQIDELDAVLNTCTDGDCLWGVTQKEALLIIRYLGDSIIQCREGLNKAWQSVRPLMLNKEAVAPRIWNT